MLSNIGIQAHLKKLGFHLMPPKNPDNYKVLQFKHKNFDNSIYVKKANRFPLVIHGKNKTICNKLLEISGVSNDSAKPLYFNSNMKDFDKQKNTGQNPEHFGLHFSFDSKPTLEHFLSMVCGKPMVMASNLIVDESTTAQNQTEKDALIKARIGQGAYRTALLDYWKGCAVTECTIESLLVASHIKPWRDADDVERINPFNGLLLSPTLDRAFDKGLISFNDAGLIMISSELSNKTLDQLGISPSMKLRKFDPRHSEYLQWHRDNLFRS